MTVRPGFYNVSVPVVVDDEFDKPYQYITLSGELQAPRMWFDPLAVVLTPVPLDTEISTEFQILAANYDK